MQCRWEVWVSPCSNCLPSRRGHCSNTMQFPVSPDHGPSPLDPFLSTLSSSSSTPLATSLAAFSPLLSPALCNPVRDSIPSPHLLTSYHLAQVSATLLSLSSHSNWCPISTLNSALVAPTFVWGLCDADTFTHSLSTTYAEVILEEKYFYSPLIVWQGI